MELYEYKEISASLRQYGNMRFLQLSLISAITGAAVVVGKQLDLGELTSMFIPFVALAFTIAIWVMEESSTSYWVIYRERAVELEKILGFNHYSLHGPKRKLSATNAVRGIYLILTIFWSVTIMQTIIELLK